MADLSALTGTKKAPNLGALKTQETPFDATNLGIFVNTVKGLPTAAREIFFPGRGFSEEEIKESRPGFKESALAIPRVAAEFSSIVGGVLGSSPGSGVERLSQTKIGGKLADVGARIQDFAEPKTAEEAAAMRFADVVLVLPMGSLKVSTSGAQSIAKTRNLNTIRGVLKKEIPNLTDEAADAFGRVLVNVDNADDVLQVINRTNFALNQVRRTGATADTTALTARSVPTPTTPVSRAATPTVRGVPQALRGATDIAPEASVRPVEARNTPDATSVPPSTDEVFATDIVGKPNKFKSTDLEEIGMKAIEKNRRIVQAKLLEVIDAEKTGDKLLRESKMREAIALAEKSNDVLSTFEKNFGKFREPYNTREMQRTIVGGLREEQLAYSENLSPLGTTGEVKVYRGIKSDTTGTAGGNKVYPGDFVSLNREYADTFGDILIEDVLPKADLRVMSGADELIYNPQAQITKQANAPEFPNYPAVIQGETFTLGTGGPVIPATEKQVKNALKAEQAAAKLSRSEQATRERALESLTKQRGNTDTIINRLKQRGLSDADIENIILEDGTRLVDTVKVKRTKDGTLSTVITKEEIDSLKSTYTDEIPKNKWTQRNVLVEGMEIPANLAKSIELPFAYFGRKGLGPIYDDVIRAGRDTETMKNMYLQRFKDEGLFKESNWFQGNRFTISNKESNDVARYYLERQGRGGGVTFEDLSPKAKRFVEIFDGVIADTEPRFFETAKKLGRTPGRVENYAPILTRKDMKLAEEVGSMDWLYRTHPSFFSTKERAKNVPLNMYEMDYREVANRWLNGITEFINMGDTTNHLKYLTDSEEFASFVKSEDLDIIKRWLKEVTTPEVPQGTGGKALNELSRFFRKTVAVGSLGLNYATVMKQGLTQVPLTIIEKAPPKLRSQYARDFGIDVANLPSITRRRGDIAIGDIKSKIGTAFTGPLTEFDKMNAQASLNSLLDKEYNKFRGSGAPITPQIRAVIEKNAQDTLDMWYGGFFKGQRPEAFRKELGNFLLMFLYPMTSQLNGFYRNVAIRKGLGPKARATAEVLAAATAIAYMEQTIENLSPEWSDEKQMTEDVLLSLMGNIPVVGNIAYAVVNDREFNPSPVVSNINNVIRAIGQDDPEKLIWTVSETFGLPKTFRRIREGLQIMEDGGITDSDGKMLAPVEDTIELVRAFMRGKYGPLAAKDWIRNIGETRENRQWFIPQVEFLQNGDYERKAELYRTFTPEEQVELRNMLSEGQQKLLDSALGGTPGSTRPNLFQGGTPTQSTSTERPNLFAQ